MKLNHPLAVVGNVNVDLILGPVAPWPVPGTEVMTKESDLRATGAAGTAAEAWAAMGIPHQIAANTGNDPLGAWLRDAFAPGSARWPVSAGATTVSVGVTHPDGERTFLTTPGHLSALDWPAVEGMLDWPALAGGVLLLCGTFITETLARDYDALFARARTQGIRVALDTGWPPGGWDAALRPQVAGWIAQCDYLLFNSIEAAAQSGAESPDRAALALVSEMPEGGVAVVKCGPDGAVSARAGELFRCPAPKVEIVDTIGAGDVFNAGFLAARAIGRPLRESLEEGCRIASAAISSRPRRYPELMYPKPEEAADERA